MHEAEQRWGAPVYVSPPGVGVDPPHLVAGGDGTIVSAWSVPGAAQVSMLRPGATDWSTPHAFKAADDALMTGPRAAVAMDGTVVVVWRGKENPNARVEVSILRAGSGSWSPPVSLSPAYVSDLFPAHSPRVAVTKSGAIVVAWCYQRRVQAAVLHRRAKAWTEPIDIIPDGLMPTRLEVIANVDGSVTIAWFDSAYEARVVESTSDVRLERWSGPRYISQPIKQRADATDDYASDNNSLQLVAAPDGSTTVVWCVTDGVSTRILVSSRTARAREWSPPRALCAESQVSHPRIAADPASALLVVWESPDGVMMSTQRQRSAEWSSAKPESGGGKFLPEVAGRPGGGFTVISHTPTAEKRYPIQATTLAPSGSRLAGPEVIPPEEGSAAWVQIASTDWGTVVTYAHWDGQAHRVQATVKTAGRQADPVKVSAGVGWFREWLQGRR